MDSCDRREIGQSSPVHGTKWNDRVAELTNPPGIPSALIAESYGPSGGHQGLLSTATKSRVPDFASPLTPARRPKSIQR